MSRSAIEPLGPCTWEIPVSAHEQMNVPVRIIASETQLERISSDDMLEQVMASASLPGVLGHVVIMPDARQSGGTPVGSVVATAYPGGVVAPGAIGDDINCGMRLLASPAQAEDVSDLEALAEALFNAIPSGPDAEPPVSVARSDSELIAQSGAQWAYRRGFAEQDDLVRIEEGGRLSDATLDHLPTDLTGSIAGHIGTLEEGDHFVEVSVVEEVLEPSSAQIMRLTEGGLVVQIHAGSAAFGRAVTGHFVDQFTSLNGDTSPVAYCEHENSEASHYQESLQAAANVAYANRQVLAHQVREAFKEELGEDGPELHTVYDMAHNMGRLEMHQINGRHLRCYVHRKGAVRAFGPGTPGIASPYRALGNPVLMPGQLGRHSWVWVGTHRGMRDSFASSCHSGGYSMPVSQTNGTIGELLRHNGVAFRSHREAQLSEPAESTDTFVSDVADSVDGAGLARPVARLRPLAIVHG